MIYVALTTVPDRLVNEQSMKLNLQALLNQDINEPYKILISIPYKYKNYESVTIPEWFKQFLTNDKIVLLRDIVDYGPITNLIYPLKQVQMNPEDVIIVCDDDHEYETTMVSYHMKMLKKYPDNHAICFRGNGGMQLRTWYHDGKKLARFWGCHVYFPTDRDLYLKLPDHWHSVSYKRKFFRDDIFDESFLNKSWNNDHLMGIYAFNHNFYFLCAYVPEQIDTRPVNYDGRSSSSYPIKNQLPFNPGGCYLWRQNPYDDSIVHNLNYEQNIFEFNTKFKDN